MDLLEVRDVHVGVDLRGGKRSVPQEFLDETDVCPRLQKVRRARVAQRVRRRVSGQPRFLRALAHHLAEVRAGESSPPSGQEYVVWASFASELRAGHLEIFDE